MSDEELIKFGREMFCRCPKCEGNGKIEGAEHWNYKFMYTYWDLIECPLCEGEGFVTKHQAKEYSLSQRKKELEGDFSNDL